MPESEYKSEESCDCNLCVMIRHTTWISVKDKEPEDDEHVLVYDRTDGICIGYHYLNGWSHYPIGSYAGDGSLFDVTHWMPLPKPPKDYMLGECEKCWDHCLDCKCNDRECYSQKKAFLVSASGDFRNDDEPTSILMKRMMDAFSEYERLIIGVRTRAALQVKKSRNERVGYIPYGFKLSEDEIHLEQHKDEQEILSKIREGREFGLSLRKIARDLNEMGFPNRLGPWNHVSIKRVMK